ncbi:MAG: hypothetical protein ACLGRW_14285 [Acidobacteriota bacterium]
MDRRRFIQGTSAAALAAAVPASRADSGSDRKTVGIQVGAVSFVDEGVEQVLDIFQQDAAVNTLFVATFTYGRGIAGRQVPGQPLPDHGKQQYDTGTFFGGCYTAVNPKYFADTSFKSFRAPDLGNFDVLEAVLPSARKRGLKTICWFEDVFRRDLPGIQDLEEKELSGENAATLCFNNPGYRNWLLGIVEDWSRSYEIDGIMWGSERQGAFLNMLGASHGRAEGGHVTCFCSYCTAKARARGIDPERARAGFLELQKFVTAAHQRQRPVDGYYVTLWRIILRYPELLAWEMLWTDSLRETYAAIYEKVKSVNPSLQVGWHIWHNNSFSPFYRAEQDLAAIAPHSDFLKIVMYNNCAGERMARYIGNMGASMFADVPGQELLDFHYRVLDYAEPSLAEIPFTGFSADYVYRETKRARAGLNGTRTLLLPGIDIDIPTAEGHSKCTPPSVRDAVLAAFHGGADGVLLSRKYSEMRLAHLKAAGGAVRELGLA